MTTIAAFCWNGSNDKSISYMVIDDKYRKIISPTIIKLDAKHQELFKEEAQRVIKTFFNKIEAITKKNGIIKIEYKIVGHASSAIQFHTKIHKPSDCTEFVREKFFEEFNKIDGNSSIKLEKQFRKKLTKPILNEFKQHLNDLHLVEKEKNNAFQYHLWSIALHITKSNYRVVLNRLHRTLRQAQESKKVVKLPQFAKLPRAA